LTTIFFATDVHGSDICWKKFINAGKFYKADILILGGDLTGKAIVPIVYQGNSTHKVVLLQQTSLLHSEAEVEEMAVRIRSRGYYPYRTTPDEVAEINADSHRLDQLFISEVLKRAQQWLEYADEKLKDSGIPCYLSPGNDDMLELDGLIGSSKHVRLAEGQVIQLDERHEMISSGWTNFTPWHTFREESEEQLLARFEAMIGRVKDIQRCIFNLHVPPYKSSLDDAPELTEDMRPKYAGNALMPVGSKAVRDVIEKYQPILGLHGHIHEAKGTTRLGRSLCINPGSMYEQGTLLGVVAKLDHTKVKNYILTTG
jgi:Icc-related predicted phosphoesterase